MAFPKHQLNLLALVLALEVAYQPAVQRLLLRLLLQLGLHPLLEQVHDVVDSHSCGSCTSNSDQSLLIDGAVFIPLVPLTH